ncbi:YicC/YloC family endoribonuclease [Membranihabitans maritimus]|uniref:YicC/YloC family endoribonuclease n=1 Tax=Membranihabitans maritimus TaxID=2904244 RepID=UPI001F2307DE|nr:YicC/YloC family endoribonuclease [Membranihabitans maritimus]
MHSMTGYGSANDQVIPYEINVEVKTLNGKFADVRLKIPSELNSLEMDIRSLALNIAKRGKIELHISLDSHSVDDNLCEIDEKVFKAYYHQLSRLADSLEFEKNDILSSIVRLPGVVKIHELTIDDSLKSAILQCVEKALVKLDEHRKTEGEVLKETLEGNILRITENQKEVENLDDERIKSVKDRLQQSLEKNISAEQLDSGRFEQELIYYLDKLDITEEMVRLKQHCEYFLEEINADEILKGKKLNFISQEIGREINTLGAKASHSEIQRYVVQMKNELDKIKEQLANVL